MTNEIMFRHIVLTEHELATVLAALRYWQRNSKKSATPEWDIATSAGEFDPLTDGQIDTLCERLNLGTAKEPVFLEKSLPETMK